jgi:pimeloyl-ACP methyl ester carboxylesterase
MAERIVDVSGAVLCTEPFGDPADPPGLLVMGIGSSMLWWEEGFCRLLADGGRYVIRYDHRDTGRSTSYEPGNPGYTSADLVSDAAGVLDAYEIPSAHVVGVSAGGALAQVLALRFPDRVRSLVLISTSPAVPIGRSLPPPTEEFAGFFEAPQDGQSELESMVAYSRMLAGGRREFDEAATRDLIHRDMERAVDFAAARNHELLGEGDPLEAPLSSIGAPTLVIHGSADPMFPLEHGEALAAEIPDARLLTLHDAGHGIDRADSEAVASAILEHTAAAEPSRSPHRARHPRTG